MRELLPSSLLEEFSGKENEYLWIKEALTEIELIVDSTEQDIFRPKNDEKQKKYYSGKQKSHRLKNQIIITDNGKEIVDVIVGERGPESDIILFKKQQKKFDKEQRFQGDKGYQGGERIDTPKKKQRNHKMSYKVKKENQKKAQKRIFVEHVIRLIKIFKVARERFRLKESNYEKVILTICGLVRLRIGALMLT